MSRKMRFEPGGRQVKLTQLDETVLDCANRSNIDINQSCGGMGTCGTCRIIVQSDLKLLPPPNEIEAEMMNDRGFAANERLACQLLAEDDLVVEICRPIIKA